MNSLPFRPEVTKLAMVNRAASDKRIAAVRGRARIFIFSTICVALAAGLLAGAVAWKTGRPVFPESIYPDLSPPMVISQSIQVTCYAASGLVSLLFLGWIVWRRAR